ncbi:MAG: C39 family peptidase [Candidatus Sungbacteria bacterium]|uniref:C39 family peptidase n=1 Tax=Candidatus Sungiibacteriota bacterium TaxID=2750080 RepID=A0A9D6QTY9_9BACT|nr:C39 family peptidase [Candidatus Sungbacteria bacterium]
MKRIGCFLGLFLWLSALPALAVQEADTTTTHFFSLSVPFVVQAPFGDWSSPWQDFCEEASITMSYSYLTGKVPDKYESALVMLRLAIFEMKTLGYDKDTDVRDTERMMHEYFGYMKTLILKNPSVADIKNALLSGNLVLAPFDGQLVDNPYYVPPGPRYHMVVIKGYDNDNFIVNDPGTRHGEGFRYPINSFMNAIHDLVTGDIREGPKSVLVIEK